MEFNYRSQDYYANQQIDIDVNCNAITIINKGDTPLIAAGVTLMPSPLNTPTPLRYAGESYTIGGNRGEILKTILLIQFVSPIGADPCVSVIQKYYLA